jgi:hypothetical protein
VLLELPRRRRADRLRCPLRRGAGRRHGWLHQSNLNVDARASSAGIDSGSFGAYAGVTFGAFKLRAGGSATFASIDVSRTIAFSGCT